MPNPPTNYTWIPDEKPTSRELNARLSDVANFLLNPPMVRLRKIDAGNIANSTVTPLKWSLVEVENYNMWDASQGTRITPSVPGWYVGTAGISFNPNTSGYREMDVRKNGVTTSLTMRTKCDAWTSSGTTVVMRGTTFLEQFNGTTDYIEVTAWQNSGVSLGLSVDVIERQPEVSLRWLAAL